MILVRTKVGAVGIEGSKKILMTLKTSVPGFGNWLDVGIEAERSSLLNGGLHGWRGHSPK